MSSTKQISVIVAMAMSMSVAASAAPRQTIRGDLPLGVGHVEAWVSTDPGESSNGSNVAVRPEDLQAPAAPIQPSAVPQLPRSVRPPVEAMPGPEGAQLPDLVPLPAYDVYAGDSDEGLTAGDFVVGLTEGDAFPEPLPVLRFATTIVNRGRFSLEVLGRPVPTGNQQDPLRTEALQCTRWEGPLVFGAPRACSEFRPAGTLTYHAQHGHFHFAELAQYELRRDRGGKPVLGPEGLIHKGSKVGFCLGDTDYVDMREGDLDDGWYWECRHTSPQVPATLRQGISPRWGDTYLGRIAGQAISLKGVPDGIYWIVIKVNGAALANPAKGIKESNLRNNISYRRIQLYQKGELVKML